MVAAAYGIGKLNQQNRFSTEPTVENPHDRVMPWVNEGWYRGADGREFKDKNGRINRANGCKNQFGIINMAWMTAPKHEGEDADEAPEEPEAQPDDEPKEAAQ